MAVNPSDVQYQISFKKLLGLMAGPNFCLC